MLAKHSLLLRIISSLTIAAFAGSEALHAAPVSANLAGAVRPVTAASLARDPSLLDVPFEAASLKEIHQGTNGKLIIHIQDAHSNLSGQENLARALEHVITRTGIGLVLVEGADRDASLDDVRESAPLEEWKLAAKRFLYDGMISGEEYLNLTTTHPMKIVGIEQRYLYDRNLEAYAGLAGKRKGVLVYIHTVRNSLERAKNRTYPAELLDFEKKKSRESAGTFKTDLGSLFDLAAKAGVAADAAYPETRKLEELRELEKGIDFARAGLEQQDLLAALSAKSPKLIEAFIANAGRIKNSEIARSLALAGLLRTAREAGVDVSAYRELGKYAGYLDRFTGLRMDALLDELDLLEEAAYEKLLTDASAKKIRAIDRYLSVLERAYAIQMSAKDFASYRANAPEFPTLAWQSFLNSRLAELGAVEDIVPYRADFEEADAALREFYELVNRRDDAFLENARRVMDDRHADAAFLITGGYHTEHLTDLLRKAGYSYVVLTPIVTSETDRDRYEKILLEPLHGKKGAARAAAPAPDARGSDIRALFARGNPRFEEYSGDRRLAPFGARILRAADVSKPASAPDIARPSFEAAAPAKPVRPFLALRRWFGVSLMRAEILLTRHARAIIAIEIAALGGSMGWGLPVTAMLVAAVFSVRGFKTFIKSPIAGSVVVEVGRGPAGERSGTLHLLPQFDNQLYLKRIGRLRSEIKDADSFRAQLSNLRKSGIHDLYATVHSESTRRLVQTLNRGMTRSGIGGFEEVPSARAGAVAKLIERVNRFLIRIFGLLPDGDSFIAPVTYRMALPPDAAPAAGGARAGLPSLSDLADFGSPRKSAFGVTFSAEHRGDPEDTVFAKFAGTQGNAIIEREGALLERIRAEKSPALAALFPESRHGRVNDADRAGADLPEQVEAGQAYLLTRRAEGVNVENRAWGFTFKSNTHLKELAVLDDLVRIADAIALMHGEGLYHRDIGLNEVFVDQRGKVTFVDLGLAVLPEDPRFDMGSLTAMGVQTDGKVITGRNADPALRDLSSLLWITGNYADRVLEEGSPLRDTLIAAANGEINAINRYLPDDAKVAAFAGLRAATLARFFENVTREVEREAGSAPGEGARFGGIFDIARRLMGQAEGRNVDDREALVVKPVPLPTSPPLLPKVQQRQNAENAIRKRMAELADSGALPKSVRNPQIELIGEGGYSMVFAVWDENGTALNQVYKYTWRYESLRHHYKDPENDHNFSKRLNRFGRLAAKTNDISRFLAGLPGVDTHSVLTEQEKGIPLDDAFNTAAQEGNWGRVEAILRAQFELYLALNTAGIFVMDASMGNSLLVERVDRKTGEKRLYAVLHDFHQALRFTEEGYIRGVLKSSKNKVDVFKRDSAVDFLYYFLYPFIQYPDRNQDQATRVLWAMFETLAREYGYGELIHVMNHPDWKDFSQRFSQLRSALAKDPFNHELIEKSTKALDEIEAGGASMRRLRDEIIAPYQMRVRHGNRIDFPKPQGFPGRLKQFKPTPVAIAPPVQPPPLPPRVGGARVMSGAQFRARFGDEASRRVLDFAWPDGGLAPERISEVISREITSRFDDDMWRTTERYVVRLDDGRTTAFFLKAYRPDAIDTDQGISIDPELIAAGRGRVEAEHRRQETARRIGRAPVSAVLDVPYAVIFSDLRESDVPPGAGAVLIQRPVRARALTSKTVNRSSVRAIALALGQLHRAGVVHGDLALPIVGQLLLRKEHIMLSRRSAEEADASFIDFGFSIERGEAADVFDYQAGLEKTRLRFVLLQERYDYLLASGQASYRSEFAEEEAALIAEFNRAYAEGRGPAGAGTGSRSAIVKGDLTDAEIGDVSHAERRMIDRVLAFYSDTLTQPMDYYGRFRLGKNERAYLVGYVGPGGRPVRYVIKPYDRVSREDPAEFVRNVLADLRELRSAGFALSPSVVPVNGSMPNTIAANVRSIFMMYEYIDGVTPRYGAMSPEQRRAMWAAAADVHAAMARLPVNQRERERFEDLRRKLFAMVRSHSGPLGLSGDEIARLNEITGRLEASRIHFSLHSGNFVFRREPSRQNEVTGIIDWSDTTGPLLADWFLGLVDPIAPQIRGQKSYRLSDIHFNIEDFEQAFEVYGERFRELGVPIPQAEQFELFSAYMRNVIVNQQRITDEENTPEIRQIWDKVLEDFDRPQTQSRIKAMIGRLTGGQAGGARLILPQGTRFAGSFKSLAFTDLASNAFLLQTAAAASAARIEPFGLELPSEGTRVVARLSGAGLEVLADAGGQTTEDLAHGAFRPVFAAEAVKAQRETVSELGGVKTDLEGMILEDHIRRLRPDVRAAIRTLRAMAAEGRTPGGIVVTLDDWVGDPAKGADDMTFRSSVAQASRLFVLFSKLGFQIEISGSAPLVEYAATQGGLAEYRNPLAPGVRATHMGSEETLRALNVPAGGAVLLTLKPEAGPETFDFLDITGNLFVAGALSETRAGETPDERVVRFVATRKGVAFEDAQNIPGTLADLAAGKTDAGVLARARRYVALPRILGVRVADFIRFMEKVGRAVLEAA